MSNFHFYNRFFTNRTFYPIARLLRADCLYKITITAPYNVIANKYQPTPDNPSQNIEDNLAKDFAISDKAGVRIFTVIIRGNQDYNDINFRMSYSTMDSNVENRPMYYTKDGNAVINFSIMTDYEITKNRDANASHVPFGITEYMGAVYFVSRIPARNASYKFEVLDYFNLSGTDVDTNAYTFVNNLSFDKEYTVGNTVHNKNQSKKYSAQIVPTQCNFTLSDGLQHLVYENYDGVSSVLRIRRSSFNYLKVEGLLHIFVERPVEGQDETEWVEYVSYANTVFAQYDDDPDTGQKTLLKKTIGRNIANTLQYDDKYYYLTFPTPNLLLTVSAPFTHCMDIIKPSEVPVNPEHPDAEHPEVIFDGLIKRSDKELENVIFTNPGSIGYKDEDGDFRIYDGGTWRLVKTSPYILRGHHNTRPEPELNGLWAGIDYFETAPVKRNVIWTGYKWITADGAQADVAHSGTLADAPTDASDIYEGFMFMLNDGTDHFPLYAHISGSTIEWYKADGTQYTEE